MQVHHSTYLETVRVHHQYGEVSEIYKPLVSEFLRVSRAMSRLTCMLTNAEDLLTVFYLRPRSSLLFNRCILEAPTENHWFGRQ